MIARPIIANHHIIKLIWKRILPFMIGLTLWRIPVPIAPITNNISIVSCVIMAQNNPSPKAIFQSGIIHNPTAIPIHTPNPLIPRRRFCFFVATKI